MPRRIANGHTLENHLEMVKQALLSVGPEYFHVPDAQRRVQIIERAFAYEFYHQLKLCYRCTDLYVSGELRKKITPNIPESRNNTYVPDIVIHSPGIIENDVISIEIKACEDVTGPELLKDLNKLKFYTHDYLNYQMGILLIINCNLDTKLEHMRAPNKTAILEYLRDDKLQIWNIEKPEPRRNIRNRITYNECRIVLDESCLKVFPKNV